MSCNCTAYTSLIHEGKVTTATDFLKACFRAVGPMAAFRDEPITADIPKELPKPDFFYEHALDRAKQDLMVCRTYTEQDWQDFIDKQLAEYVQGFEKTKRENDELAAKLNAVKAEVEKWDCDPAYECVKKFALDQIYGSMPPYSDYYQRCIAMWKGTNAKQYGEERIRELEECIKNYEERLQDEKKEYEDKNNFIKGFHENIAKLEGK